MNGDLLGIIAVGLFGIAVIVLLFVPWRRKVHAGTGSDGCQEAHIEVKSQDFDPEIIVVAAGKPVRLTFHRRPEAPDCTGRLHLIAFGKKPWLDPGSTAPLRFCPSDPASTPSPVLA